MTSRRRPPPADPPRGLPRASTPALRRGARHPRHRARVRRRRGRRRTSATGSRRRRIPVAELAPELGKLGRAGHAPRGLRLRGRLARPPTASPAWSSRRATAGIRSLVSVQGSLAMYAIWRWGSEEQKQEWLPRMAAGEAIGCFGLTEPDAGSDPGSMRTRARRDGDGLDPARRRRCGSPTARSPTSRSCGRATDEGVRGFLVPKGTQGFTTQDIHKKLSLRASVTSELLLDDVRLPDDAPACPRRPRCAARCPA